MEFSPKNKIVQFCIMGMAREGAGKTDEALALFSQAWSESVYDFEKFISAHFLARLQTQVSDKLKWLEQALQFALKIHDDTVTSALPLLYSEIAKCYESMGDIRTAKKNEDLVAAVPTEPSSKGPFYHGTKADLQTGDLLTPGGASNYKVDLKMNHIYFTSLVNGAGLAAELAKGEQPARVYLVEPTGPFENDPNVTNHKFPGNPTLSYRSETPLKIVGEVTEWTKLTSDELRQWRERLAQNDGKIMN